MSTAKTVVAGGPIQIVQTRSAMHCSIDSGG